MMTDSREMTVPTLSEFIMRQGNMDSLTGGSITKNNFLMENICYAIFAHIQLH